MKWPKKLVDWTPNWPKMANRVEDRTSPKIQKMFGEETSVPSCHSYIYLCILCIYYAQNVHFVSPFLIIHFCTISSINFEKQQKFLDWWYYCNWLSFNMNFPREWKRIQCFICGDQSDCTQMYWKGKEIGPKKRGRGKEWPTMGDTLRWNQSEGKNN